MSLSAIIFTGGCFGQVDPPTDRFPLPLVATSLADLSIIISGVVLACLSLTGVLCFPPAAHYSLFGIAGAFLASDILAIIILKVKDGLCLSSKDVREANQIFP